MASDVGHIIGATIAWEAAKRLRGKYVPEGAAWYLLPGIIALAPDLDALARVAGLNVAHRGPSHSLLAAFGLAVAGAGFIALRLSFRHALRGFIFVFACAAMHPLLDYLMGCGPRVPLLWPWMSKGWLSPVQVIPTAYYAKSARGLAAVYLSKQTWKGILLELLSLGSLWLAVRSRQRDVTWIAMLLSVTGFALTWLLYR
jgi:inner membrane protein